MSQGDRVEAPCKRCGKTTYHRPGEGGVLHCIPCMIEDSTNPNPPSDTPTPYSIPKVTPIVPDRPRRSPAEIAAAIVTVLVLGSLLIAFLKGR